MRILSQANDIVRRKWRTTGKGWKVFLIISIIILSILAIIFFIIWSLFKLLKGLAAGVGGGRNMGLYFPRTRR